MENKSILVWYENGEYNFINLDVNIPFPIDMPFVVQMFDEYQNPVYFANIQAVELGVSPETIGRIQEFQNFDIRVKNVNIPQAFYYVGTDNNFHGIANAAALETFGIDILTYPPPVTIPIESIPATSLPAEEQSYDEQQAEFIFNECETTGWTKYAQKWGITEATCANYQDIKNDFMEICTNPENYPDFFQEDDTALFAIRTRPCEEPVRQEVLITTNGQVLTDEPIPAGTRPEAGIQPTRDWMEEEQREMEAFRPIQPAATRRISQVSSFTDLLTFDNLFWIGFIGLGLYFMLEDR